MEVWRRPLREGLRSMGCVASTHEEDLLLGYMDLVWRWGQKHNLTGFRTQESLLVGGLLNSLDALPYIKGGAWADVGSGAGLPGLPLAIMAHEHPCWLIEPRLKRSVFLQHAVASLGLRHVRVLAQRVEEVSQPVACVVTRGFAALGDALRKTEHLWWPEGVLVALKGRLDHEELAIDENRFTMKVLPAAAPQAHKDHVVVVSRRP